MRHQSQERQSACWVRTEGGQQRSLGIDAPRGFRRHRIAMKDFGKKCRLHEELVGGSDAKDQSATIKSPAFQPQSARFNEINRGDFIALPEKHFVSGERSSLECVFIET